MTHMKPVQWFKDYCNVLHFLGTRDFVSEKEKYTRTKQKQPKTTSVLFFLAVWIMRGFFIYKH